jgi:hypothetical protein
MEAAPHLRLVLGERDGLRTASAEVDKEEERAFWWSSMLSALVLAGRSSLNPGEGVRGEMRW